MMRSAGRKINRMGIFVDICGYFVYDDGEVINNAGYALKRDAHQG